MGCMGDGLSEGTGGTCGVCVGWGAQVWGSIGTWKGGSVCIHPTRGEGGMKSPGDRHPSLPPRSFNHPS